jgi:hypothetical protein
VAVSNEVDALYALPLDEFTAARNALAKKLGSEEIRKLAKPSVPAWAVNQLARRERKKLGELLKSGETLQKQVLGGKAPPAALREAQQHERQLVRDLVQRAESLLKDAGRPATAATLERVSETLAAGAQTAEGREALRAGRLTEELEPAGFEALTGLTPRRASPRDELAAARRAKDERRQERRRLEREVRKLESRAAAAEREADEAGKAAQQARAAADKAARRLAELE